MENNKKHSTELQNDIVNDISNCNISAGYQAWSDFDYYHKGVLYSIGTTAILREIDEDFMFYPDDILVVTYPKQGTTLVQEIVWLVKNKADVEKAKQSSLFQRFAFIEYGINTSPEMLEATKGLLQANKLVRPRLLKTHLPWHVVRRGVENSGMKTIVVMRNPKDSLVSFYHHARNQPSWNFGKNFPFDKFYEMFRDGHCTYGSYFEHTTEWWEQKHRDNILFLKYEDIVANKLENVRKIAQFLGETLSTEEENRILRHTSFDEMRKNPQVNFSKGQKGMFEKDFEFIRKGQVGNWKEHFTVAQNEEFDAVIEKHLGKTDLQFRYE